MSTFKTPKEFLDTETIKVQNELVGKMNAKLRLNIKSKPKYMPNWLYKWLLKQITTITTYV
jgi:hypothetical protein